MDRVDREGGSPEIRKSADAEIVPGHHLCGGRQERLQTSRGQIAGVDSRTLDAWVERGEHGGSAFHAYFVTALRRAEAVYEMWLVSLVQQGGNWKAASYILERRFPNRWGEGRARPGQEFRFTVHYEDPPLPYPSFAEEADAGSSEITHHPDPRP